VADKEDAMARDAALVVSWTPAVPGREAKALEAFREAFKEVRGIG
jgi:hypothetical protein